MSIPSNNPEQLGLTRGHQFFDTKNRVQAFATYTLLTAAAIRAPQILGADINVRDHVPEPFDIPDHAGNAAVTFALLTHFGHGFWEGETHLEDTTIYEKKRKVFGFACGAFAIAANVIGEKVGYGAVSTPDPVDFAYGLLGGYLAYAVNTPRHIPPNILKVAERIDPETTESPESARAFQQQVADLREAAKPKLPVKTIAAPSEKIETVVIKPQKETPQRQAATAKPHSVKKSNNRRKNKNRRKQQRQSHK